MKKIILVAGGTGNLGGKVIKALLERGAEVRAIVREESDKPTVHNLEKSGVKIIKVNMSSLEEVSNACMGVSCVVSTLSGLRDVIVDVQKVVLDAAIMAGVPRFIPSDYSIDFTKISADENRNLGYRKEFHKYLDKSTIAATTIFNGAFADLLTGQMPLIIFKFKRVIYWSNKDQLMDFTTMDNTATFTADVALDDSSPRYLKIAGSQVSPEELKDIVSEVTGKKFKLFRAGGLGLFKFLIKIMRFFSPGKNELYPAWQGMQYMYNMMEGKVLMDKLDNDRYSNIKWTSVREVLLSYQNPSLRRDSNFSLK